jgi:peptidoglycan-associated lipoprotein
MRSAIILFIALAGCATPPRPKGEAAKAQVAASPRQPPPAAPSTEAPRAAPPVPVHTAVHFEFDRAELTTTDRRRLEELAAALRERPELHANVAGHCDELGTEEYNLALGQRRADVAKSYLVNLGVGAGRVATVSFGENQPRDTAHTADAWAVNRRAEIECSADAARP